MKNVYWSACKLPVIFVRIKWNSNFLDRFSKNPRISNSTKSLSCCMRTDGHRDFVNAPKNKSTWHKTKLITLQVCEHLYFSVRLTAGLRLVLVWLLCVPIPVALQSRSYSVAGIAASNLIESKFCWVYSVLFRPECVCLIVYDLDT